jgi:hypothetical protein
MNATRILVGLAVAFSLVTPCLADKALEKALDKKVTISDARVTLEQALVELGGLAGINIEILVDDLRLEGLTKNQGMSLDFRDKPAREVLVAILAKADPKGRLVYVLREPGTVAVTTRSAAQKRREVALPLLSWKCPLRRPSEHSCGKAFFLV